MISHFKNAFSFGKKTKNNQVTRNNQVTTSSRISNKKSITNHNRFNTTHKRGKFLNGVTKTVGIAAAPAVLFGGPIGVGVVAISLVIIKIMKLSNNNSKLGRLMNDLSVIIMYINTNYVEKSSKSNELIIEIKTHLDNLFSLLNIIEIEINKEQKEKKKYIMKKSKSFIFNPKEKILEIITEVSLLNSLLIIDLKTSIHKMKSSNNLNTIKNNSNKNLKNQPPIQGLFGIIKDAPLNVQETAVKIIEKTSQNIINTSNGKVEPNGKVDPVINTNNPIVDKILKKIDNAESIMINKSINQALPIQAPSSEASSEASRVNKPLT